MSPDKSTLYVALSGSPPAPPGVDESTLPPPDRTADGIGVVDIRQQKLIKVLPSGTDPEAGGGQPRRHARLRRQRGCRPRQHRRGGHWQDPGDVRTGEEPEGVSVQPGAERVWVTSEEDGTAVVSSICLQRKVGEGRCPVGPRPRSVAFLPDGSRAYVPSENGATLAVVDTARRSASSQDHRSRQRDASDGHRSPRPMASSST